MHCQVVIACVVDAVHSLDRAAPMSPSLINRYAAWLKTFPDPIGFLLFFLSVVMTVLILLTVIAGISAITIELWYLLLPERPRKHRHGEFVGD